MAPLGWLPWDGSLGMALLGWLPWDGSPWDGCSGWLLLEGSSPRMVPLERPSSGAAFGTAISGWFPWNVSLGTAPLDGYSPTVPPGDAESANDDGCAPGSSLGDPN